MKKIKTKIALLLTAVVIAAAVSGCGIIPVSALLAWDAVSNSGFDQIIENIDIPSPAQTPEETTQSDQTTEEEKEKETVSPEKSGLLPKYEHYDSTEFLSKCDELRTLADAGKVDEMNALYDELYQEAIKIQNLFTISELLAYENVSSAELKAENEYTKLVSEEAIDKLAGACSYITKSKSADDFEKHLNDDFLTEYYETYIEYTDRLKELLSEEIKLENEYNTLMDGMNDLEFEYEGKEYRFGDYLDYENSALFIEDQDRFTKLFNAGYKELNRQAGEIFVQLVKIRNEIAKEYGYDNYNDYCDDHVYGRDYSASDLEQMKAAAREFGAGYQSYMYSIYPYLPEFDTSDANTIATGKKLLEGISPLSDKAMQYFEDNKLYSIGKESSRVNAGFTTMFTGEDGKYVPFMFIKTSDSAYDISTFTHEFGHFTEAYWNANPYPLYVAGCYDLFEIHSTGLQLLADANYSEVFGSDAKMMDMFNVLNLISYVTDGCLYDEWQREIYENPDMTLDEINELFKEVSEEYDISYYDGMEYSWVEINHNFTSPLYYISYATSAYASLQIWYNSLTDYSGAVSTWENIVSASAYDDGYLTVVKNAGLSTFNNKNEVLNVLNNAYNYVEAQVWE